MLSRFLEIAKIWLVRTTVNGEKKDSLIEDINGKCFTRNEIYNPHNSVALILKNLMNYDFTASNPNSLPNHGRRESNRFIADQNHLTKIV